MIPVIRIKNVYQSKPISTCINNIYLSPDSLISRYFALQCIAKLFLISPHMLSWLQDDVPLKNTIIVNMEEMIQKNKIIIQYQKEVGYFSFTFRPVVSVLYRPTYNIQPELQTICQELIVVSLLTGKNNHDVLIKEDLLDYVTCLPWHTSGSVQERAKELVTMIPLTTNVRSIQPPSLLNMTKATVAKYYCELDKVLELSVPELVWELLKK